MKNIVLVGLMGAGKSTVGKFLADKLMYDFLDTDTLIEQEQNMSVSLIFKQYGEEYFRKLENELVLKLRKNTDTVISTGGGLVQNEDNLAKLAEGSLIVYLEASSNILYKRIKSDDSRPLLQNDNPLDKLNELLNKREKNYKLANLIVNTENKSIEDIADEILKEYYANN